MDLGEQIVLTGFAEDEPGSIIIIKKIVGNFVKQFTQRHEGFERLTLTQEGETVSGLLLVKGEKFVAQARDENLFFALDACLKSLERNA